MGKQKLNIVFKIDYSSQMKSVLSGNTMVSSVKVKSTPAFLGKCMQLRTLSACWSIFLDTAL